MLNNEEKIYTAIAMLMTLRWDIENQKSKTKYLIWHINHIIKMLEEKNDV